MTTTPIRPAFAGATPSPIRSLPAPAPIAPPGVLLPAQVKALAQCLNDLKNEAEDVLREGRALLAGVLALLPKDAGEHLALAHDRGDASDEQVRDARNELCQSLNHVRALLSATVLYQFSRIGDLLDNEIDPAREIASEVVAEDAFTPGRAETPARAQAAAVPPALDGCTVRHADDALFDACMLLRSTAARASQLEQDGSISSDAHEELRRLLCMATAQVERVASVLLDAPEALDDAPMTAPGDVGRLRHAA